MHAGRGAAETSRLAVTPLCCGLLGARVLAIVVADGGGSTILFLTFNFTYLLLILFSLPCSEEETELEKSAAEWAKKHRPKKKRGPGGGDFKPKANVRKGRGRKR